MQHRWVYASALALSVALFFGCRDVASVRSPRVHSVTIGQHGLGLQIGSSFQLTARVDADRGADQSVSWFTRASTSGDVSSSGLLTTCYPPGYVTVVARSVADSSVADSIRVGVSTGDFSWVAAAGAARPHDPPQPGIDVVDSRNVAGDVDLLYLIPTTGVLYCRRIEGLRATLRGPGVDTTFAEVALGDRGPIDLIVRVRFHSQAFPNGKYVFGGTVSLSGLDEKPATTEWAIEIRNP